MKTKTTLCFAILATTLIILNGMIFLGALPKTGGTQILCGSNGCTIAGRDFSAYYEAGYRFLYNPNVVYSPGNITLANGTVVTSQNFRYLPFFLPIFIVPLVILFDYSHALVVFDLIQFMLLPLMAYLLYRIMSIIEVNGKRVKNKTFALFSLTLVIALFEPFLPSFSILTFGSWSYSHLWMEGEARVLQTMLILLTIFLVLKRSRFSGIPFVLSSFDPRMSILCLPLVVYLSFRSRSLSNFALGGLISFVALYAPTLLYANLAGGFASTIFTRDFVIYAYEWVPLLTILSLTGTIFILDFAPRHRILNSEYAGLGLMKFKLNIVLKSRPLMYASNAPSANRSSIYTDVRNLPAARMRYAI